jgi:uncharacterized repeat protein (TIGR03847 family)
MDESFEFDPVDWITAGAVGEPGQRVFYLQAAAGSETVALVVEKEQVRLLAHLAQQLLARAGVTVTPDDLDEEAQRLREPVEELWRAGSLGLGMDQAGERFMLEAEELIGEEDDPGAVARFWMDRDQLVALAAHAAYAVAAGARPSCRLCGRPTDQTGHVCPSLNGHGAVERRSACVGPPGRTARELGYKGGHNPWPGP